MEYRKITAIVASEKLEDVEKVLSAMHVSGISITQVRGYGEYHNFYQNDMMCRHARIEIFCRTSEADAIAQRIIETAHAGVAGDGVVAILPVEKFYRIRTRNEAGHDDV